MKIFKSAMLATGVLLGAFALQAADVAPSRFVKKESRPSGGDAAAPKKVMKRLTAGGSNVYGYVGWDLPYDQDLATTQVGALYNFGANGYTIKWNDPMWEAEMSLMRTGYLVYDKETDRYVLTGTVPVYYTGNPNIISVCNYTYDFETGKLVNMNFPGTTQPYFLNAAYNEDDGYIYGLAEYQYSQNKSPFFGKAKIDNPNNIQQLSNLNSDVAFSAMCWNSDDKYIYGILPDGAMMRVDSNGRPTQVAYFKEPIAGYQTGLAYSPVEKLFYWNVIFPSGRSCLYTIDLNAEGGPEFTYLYDFENEEEFHFFVTTDKPANPKAPVVAEVKEINFPKGATTGSVTFIMPRKKADNTTINPEASMRYQVGLDGEDYTGGNALPGEEVIIDFIELSEEMHSFSFTTSLDGVSSLPTARETFIGVDTPKTPGLVEMTEDRITWEAVTEGVHSGYIDLADLHYDVYVDGEKVGTTKDLQFDITLDADTPLHKMTSSVVAVAGGKQSDPGVSNAIVAGKAMSLPVFFAPTSDDDFISTSFDGNYDGNGWNYSAVEKAWVCLHSLEGKGNDWLFLPPVEITDASKYYVLSFDSRIVSNQYPDESMEVTIGKSSLVTDQTQVVKAAFTPTDDYSKYEALIKVDEPGNYTVSFHYVSAEMQNGIYLRNVGISDKGLDPATPVAVAEVKAVPAADGKLEAEVSFNMPSVSINGKNIDATKSMTATVKAGSESKEVSGKAGELVKVNIPTAQGDNVVTVAVTLEGNTSLQAQTVVYTGLDIPAGVENLRAEVSEDMMSVKMKWDLPVKGEHDGYVGTGGFTYDVYLWTTSLLGPNWEKVGSADSNLEYTYTFPEGAPQDFYQFGIRACNSAGNAAYVTMTAQIAGMPYSIPMVEDFANYETDFSTEPWMVVFPTAEHSGYWNVTPINDFDSKQSGSLLVAGGPRGSRARITLPRFSSVGQDQLFASFIMFGGEGTEGLDLYAYTYDNPAGMKVGSVPANANEGFYKASVALPSELLGKNWVALEFDAYFPDNNSITAVRRLEVSPTDFVEGVTEQKVDIVGGEGELTVFGAEGETLDIYAADGRKAAHVERASLVETVSLPAGLYIVRGVKVIVR